MPESIVIVIITICFELLLTGGAAPASNWGDGFASQPEVLSQFPTCGISNPGPVFFQPLLSTPYLSQVNAVLKLCSTKPLSQQELLKSILACSWNQTVPIAFTFYF